MSSFVRRPFSGVATGTAASLDHDIWQDGRGFRLFGEVRIDPGASPSGTVLRVREYGRVGGVQVTRTR
jgi:hypothetical protein